MENKRRYPLLKLKKLLEHLESNYFNESKRKAEVLYNSFPSKEVLDKIIRLCKNKKYISPIDIREGDKIYSGYEITLEGIDFLEQLRKKDIEKQNQQIQQNLVLTSIIIALSSVFTIFNQVIWKYKSLVQFTLLILIVILLIKSIKEFLGKGERLVFWSCLL